MSEYKMSEGKNALPHLHSTEQLHATKSGHHAGAEAHVKGLKEAEHKLEDAKTVRKVC